MAALDRVAEAQAGCDRTVTRRLAEIAGPVSERGDEDVRVGRAAVSALGRCGGPEAVAALRELIEDGGVDLSQRAEAGRQLIAHDPEGPDFVAELLLSGAYPDLDRSFADALGKSPAATPQIREALCRTAEANPMVASTAHDSFTALFPGESCEP
nr:HEAT repeat domain-containing protein [Pseudenhygromyxa sp. WMMC2535]